MNEDTIKESPEPWNDTKNGKANLYISPELAKSSCFQALWKVVAFRDKVPAVIVDEAHCIDEMGGPDFRPEYRELSMLRSYVGYDVPVVALTVTASDSTFDVIWRTLNFGVHPF